MTNRENQKRFDIETLEYSIATNALSDSERLRIDEYFDDGYILTPHVVRRICEHKNTYDYSEVIESDPASFGITKNLTAIIHPINFIDRVSIAHVGYLPIRSDDRQNDFNFERTTLERITRVMRRRGYYLDVCVAYDLWDQHSDDYCASWLTDSRYDDDKLTDTVLDTARKHMYMFYQAMTVIDINPDACPDLALEILWEAFAGDRVCAQAVKRIVGSATTTSAADAIWLSAVNHAVYHGGFVSTPHTPIGFQHLNNRIMSAFHRRHLTTPILAAHPTACMLV